MTDTNSQRQQVTSRDLLELRIADDPQISPDGKHVAWVKTWMVPDENRYRSGIVVTDVESGDSRDLSTSGEGRDTHPRWSPDGRWVAFLSTRAQTGAQATIGPASSVVGRGPQLCVVPADGGEPRVLTDLRGGVHEPAWSPDGSRLAFTTFVDPDKGLEFNADQATAEDAVDPYAKYNRDVLTARRMKWKLDGTGYYGGYYRQVALVSFDAGDPSIPRPLLLSRGEFDLVGPTWSSDGGQIAVVGNVNPDADRVRRQYVNIVNTQGSHEASPQEVFGLEDIRHPGLAWSPDGSMLAVVGHDDPQIGHYGNQDLWIVELERGGATCLTKARDRTFGTTVWTDVGGYGGDSGVKWLPRGDAVLLLLSDGGTQRLCRVDVPGGEIAVLTPEDLLISGFTIDAAGNTAVALVWEAMSPGDIYSIDLQSSPPEVRRLTSVNAEFLADRKLSVPQKFQLQADGPTVDAWIIPPVARQPGERYPTILYNGGGPGGMRSFNFMLEYQLLAAHGYAVVYCNARGSQGYGEDFCTAILGDWGGADYADNVRAVRTAIEEFDFVDPDRLGVAGGSYGGYQVNWIIGHNPEFKAAVSDRSVFNRYSSYGTSDIGHVREFEFGDGPPWETTEHYLRQSPLRFVGNVRAPTLVVHSDQDLRCPVEQGDQLYMALKHVGVTTELVRFPNESHGLSRQGRPWHRVYRLDRYVEWFDRWL